MCPRSQARSHQCSAMARSAICSTREWRNRHSVHKELRARHNHLVARIQTRREWSTYSPPCRPESPRLCVRCSWPFGCFLATIDKSLATLPRHSQNRDNHHRLRTPDHASFDQLRVAHDLRRGVHRSLRQNALQTSDPLAAKGNRSSSSRAASHSYRTSSTAKPECAPRWTARSGI